jgi:hypothetical protein
MAGLAKKAQAVPVEEAVAKIKADDKAQANGKSKATTHPCLCGCGGKITSKARFLMGHDSKLKSKLIHAAIAGDKAAESEIGKLGWSEFLAKSRNNLKAKAKAKS